MWLGLADGEEDWVPIGDIYYAAIRLIETVDFDVNTILLPIVKHIIQTGIAVPGEISGGFIPWRGTLNEQLRKIEEVVSENPILTGDYRYSVWFNMDEHGILMLNEAWTRFGWQ